MSGSPLLAYISLIYSTTAMLHVVEKGVMLGPKSSLHCRGGLDLTFFFEALYLWPERSLSTTRTTSLAVMAFEHHEDNKLWHYMETLPRIMPENTLSPLLFSPLLSLSLSLCLILYFCLPLSDWITSQLFLFSFLSLNIHSLFCNRGAGWDVPHFTIKANTVTIAHNAPINNSNNSVNKPHAALDTVLKIPILLCFATRACLT